MELDGGLVEKDPHARAQALDVGRAALRNDDRAQAVVDERRGVVALTVEMALGCVQEQLPARRDGRAAIATGLAVDPLAEDGVDVVRDKRQPGNLVFGQRTLALFEKRAGDDALVLARLGGRGGGLGVGAVVVGGGEEKLVFGDYCAAAAGRRRRDLFGFHHVVAVVIITDGR